METLPGISLFFSLPAAQAKSARFLTRTVDVSKTDRARRVRPVRPGGSGTKGVILLQDTKRHPWETVRLVLLLLAAALLLGLGTTARAAEPRYVIPMGSAVGIKLFSDGVLVVGFTDVATADGPANPARDGGLKTGDVITRMDGQEVSSIEEVQDILSRDGDHDVDLHVRRDGEEKDLTIRAVKCSADGTYKLGAWIRDSMAGVGTLTFADPDTGLFGTLGHGVNDVDTAVLLELQSGAITPAAVAGVVKGEDGRPGELRGAFSEDRELGTLFANTEQGVFGYLTDPGSLTGRALPVAEPDQVHPGPATILANVSGTEVAEYEAEILKVFDCAADSRDLMLKVTDRRLLEKTGGIVQGMSGSPILQDGRLAGAVTHVLIDHADRGYGILAAHMLEAAENG